MKGLFTHLDGRTQPLIRNVIKLQRQTLPLTDYNDGDAGVLVIFIELARS
jgi:hypothetical protein